MLNPSIRFENGALVCDSVSLAEIARSVGTPVYVYSLKRALGNFRAIRTAFEQNGLDAHIHYSAKANGNLDLLRTLIMDGAGIDAVSGGEIFCAMKAGAQPENIVFAGVGKTPADLRYAVEQGIGWFNVENAAECLYLNTYAAEFGRAVRVSLRLNPNVAAKTHPHIATGHGGAKFGLSADVVDDLLTHADRCPHLRFEGIHVHIGSQLHEVDETVQAVQIAVNIAKLHPSVNTIDIGGGFPIAYRNDDELPPANAFAAALAPVLKGYQVILEPGRSIVADAGVLITSVLYTKSHDDQTFVIVDAGMTELIRPMLYESHHEIVPLFKRDEELKPVTVVGPICESTDVFRRDVSLPNVVEGEPLAILDAGAYGMVMASNYNARPRPAEVVVSADGESWRISRRRETWDDLIALES